MKPLLKKWVMVMLFALFVSAPSWGQEWKSGTLLNYTTHQETNLDEGTKTNAGISCFLVVDVGDRLLYVHHHVGFIWEHLPQMTENGPIKWRNDNGMFVYLDDHGRKFKAYVSKTRMKTPPGGSPEAP